MGNLFLLRGLPGAGKSTIAELMAENRVAADDFFDIYHGGTWLPSKLTDAHRYCYETAKKFIDEGKDVAVHNTFAQQWEMEPYVTYAKTREYTVHIMIVENRHGNRSIHGVPDATLEKMKKRFEVCL